MEKERLIFIIQKGVLGWGLATGIIWSIVMTLIYSGYARFNFKLLISYLSTACIIFHIGGLIWGYWVWSLKRKK